jgi:hypothetical protein
MTETGFPPWVVVTISLAGVLGTALGPLITTWLTNRQALKVLDKQNLHDRDARLRQSKQEAYDGALQVLGRGKLALVQGADKGQDTLHEVNAALTRLYIFGSPKVMEAVKAAEDNALRFYGVKGSEAPERWRDYVDAVDALGTAIREDMER